MTEEHIIELFHERCSIIEFEAKLTRDEATRLAFADLRDYVGRNTKLPKRVIDEFREATNRLMQGR